MKNTIFITGTPCTGKTTVSEVLSEKLNCRLIKINDLAIENDYDLGIDEDKGYKIIDIDALNDKVSQIIRDSDELIIFEGHLAHLCSGADKIIVLRVHPEILRKRLEERDYSESKIRENELSVDEIVDLIDDVISDKKEFPVGEVDFMEWLI